MTDKQQKRRDALGLFYESVLKPDHELRKCSHNQECFHELMEWRLKFLNILIVVEMRSFMDELLPLDDFCNNRVLYCN